MLLCTSLKLSILAIFSFTNFISAIVLTFSFFQEYNCNGTIVEHPEYGEVIQLTGDQRQHIKDFLCKVGIVKEENCKIHGF